MPRLYVGLFMAVALVATAQTAHAAEDSPLSAIAEHFPAMRELWGTMLPEILALAARLERAEMASADKSCVRQALIEVRWRLESTADTETTRAAMLSPPNTRREDAEGSYGICTDPWFLKLDASAYPLLLTMPDPAARPAPFLDLINDPTTCALRAHPLDHRQRKANTGPDWYTATGTRWPIFRESETWDVMSASRRSGRHLHGWRR